MTRFILKIYFCSFPIWCDKTCSFYINLVKIRFNEISKKLKITFFFIGGGGGCGDIPYVDHS
jgi:hypothetical protein